MEPKDELKKARGKRTQEQMAAELKVPLSSYRKWEQGDRGIPDRIMDKIRGIPQSLYPKVSMPQVFRLDQAARKAGVTIEQLIFQYIQQGLESENEKSE